MNLISADFYCSETGSDSEGGERERERERSNSFGRSGWFMWLLGRTGPGLISMQDLVGASEPFDIKRHGRL